MAEPAEAKVETKVEKGGTPRFVAKLRHARISPRKMRYVVDMIRGKDYNSAISILRSCPRRGAMFCKKLLESAYGNAVHLAQERNLDIDGNRLHLVEARVDGGPVMKRWRPSSQRRPQMIRKRISHVLFALEERDLKETRGERNRRQKQERQKVQSAKKTAAAGAKKTETKDASGATVAPSATRGDAKAKTKAKAGTAEASKKKKKGSAKGGAKGKEDSK